MIDTRRPEPKCHHGFPASRCNIPAQKQVDSALDPAYSATCAICGAEVKPGTKCESCGYQYELPPSDESLAAARVMYEGGIVGINQAVYAKAQHLDAQRTIAQLRAQVARNETACNAWQQKYLTANTFIGELQQATELPPLSSPNPFMCLKGRVREREEQLLEYKERAEKLERTIAQLQLEVTQLHMQLAAEQEKIAAGDARKEPK